MFKLVAEDLSSLGGPMGSEKVVVIFTRYFNSVDNAKAAAEKDYISRSGARANTIKWREEWRERMGRWYSGDLGFIDYTITPVVAED